MTVASLILEYGPKISLAVREKRGVGISQLFKEYSDCVKNLSLPEEEIDTALAWIAKNIYTENADLWITAADWHPSDKYLDSLHAILENERAVKLHERVVNILYDLADPRSIPILTKGLTYEDPSDPSRELALRILHALDKIGGTEVQRILESYSQSPSPRIREEALFLITGQRPDDD